MNNPPHIQRWAGLLAELRFAATAAAGGLLLLVVIHQLAIAAERATAVPAEQVMFHD